MKLTIKLGCLVLFSLIINTSIASKKEWVKCSDGFIPKKALKCGHDLGGKSLYLIRVKHNNSLSIGKTGKHLGKAHFAYGNREITSNNYQIYTGKAKWKAAKNGKIPTGAVVLGYDTDGKPLFAARAKFKSTIQLGKMKWGFQGAHIAFGGREIEIKEYEILVKNYKWEKVKSNRFPLDVRVAAYSSNGKPVFISKGKIGESLCPGYCDFEKSYFPYSNKAFNANDYKVLKGKARWSKKDSKQIIPLNSIVTGYEKNGQPLFTVKAIYNEIPILGKMREDFKSAHFIINNAEKTLNGYRTLIIP
jgi:hypothetical protein